MKTQPYEQYPETYIKLLQWIREFVQKHDTNRLPSEEELAVRFGVSRVKIRDVLSQLEAAGYVTRKRGVGTRANRYVLAEAARLDIDSIYVDIIVSYGYRPRSILHKLKLLREPPQLVLQKLGLQPGGSVYQFEKIIYADDQPVIFVVDYIPAQYYDDSENSNLALMDTNIFLFLQGMCNELLEAFMVHMDVCLAEGQLADIMELKEGFPLMKLDSVCYTQASEAVMYSVEYYNTKLIPFSFQKRVLSGKFKRNLPPERFV